MPTRRPSTISSLPADGSLAILSPTRLTADFPVFLSDPAGESAVIFQRDYFFLTGAFLAGLGLAFAGLAWGRAKLLFCGLP